MKKSILLSTLIAGSALLGAGTAVIAQDDATPPPPPAPPEKQMREHGPRGPHGPGLKMFDADKDGTITKAEIDAFQTKMFAEADTDKDGFLTPEEMTAHHEKKREEMRKKRMEERKSRMLAKLDTDKDGKISKEEFAAKPMPHFDRIDANDDGVLDEAELKAAKDKHKGKKGKFRKFKGERGDKIED